MAEQLITIQNAALKVEISTLGAELQSIIKNDTEYLWNGDPDVWKMRAPLMFPICGGLKDDEYEINGKRYCLEKHGYARFCEFEVEKKEKESVTFLLKSNEESKKVFPFEYELRVIYIEACKKSKIRYLCLNEIEKENGHPTEKGMNQISKQVMECIHEK